MRKTWRAPTLHAVRVLLQTGNNQSACLSLAKLGCSEDYGKITGCFPD
ncbi:hypothetical protein [Azospirillum doebereinerae]